MPKEQIIQLMIKLIEHFFSKEGVQIINNYMKKYLTSLAIEEMRIKMTLRFHLSSGNHPENKCL
jgi:hypothetical protein